MKAEGLRRQLSKRPGNFVTQQVLAILVWHFLSHLVSFLGFILVLFGNEGQQNISKAKRRGKGRRLFRRDPPSTLENILFQSWFCYRVRNICFFLGLLFSARQVCDSSSHTCSFFHSIVSSSYVVSLPLIMQRRCLSWNSPSHEGCCNRQLPVCKLPGSPLLRPKTWQRFIFSW